MVNLAFVNLTDIDAVMGAGNKVYIGSKSILTPRFQENSIASQLDLPLQVAERCDVHRWRSYTRPLRA